MSDAPSDSNGGEPRQEAEQLYVEFLGSDEASLTDGFERLAQRHPQLEGELRSLHAEFENLERVLDEAAASPEFPFEELSRLHARGGHKRYRIEGEIARGGQGAVMRIWDSDLKRHLAMKLTLGRVTSSTAGDGNSPTPASSTPPLDSRTIHRFLNEAKITGQLDHPGIVPIHELGVDDDGQAYFTMKLVNGHSLHEVFHRHRQGDPEWTTQRCVGLILKATEAVAYAHSKGIIHRDLKPANIMVGEYGEVYVMDWGMARGLTSSSEQEASRLDSDDQRVSTLSTLVTQEGGVFGTPAYMPPEQARGEISKLDPRSDVYALGAVLYELQTGHAPYKDLIDGSDYLGLLGLVTSRPPSSIEAIAAGAHPELVAIANKAMERRPDNRYSSATELLIDLRAHSEGRVVAAFEFGVIPELRKWIQRNRSLATAIALTVGVSLAALLAVALSEYRRAESDRMRLAEAEVATLEDQVLRVHNGLGRPFPPGALSSGEVHYWQGWLDDVQHTSGRLNEMRLRAGGADWKQISELAVGALDVEHPDVARARLQRVYADAIGKFPLGDRAEFTAEEASHYRAAAEVFAGSASYLEDNHLVNASLLRQFDRGDSREQREEYLLNAWAGMKGLGQRGIDAKLERVRSGLKAQASGKALEAAGGDGWEGCLAHIADPVRSPRYEGLSLSRHPLLEPLAYDTASQLWEFWMPSTGLRPEQKATGGWAIEADTALVMVLIPGSEVRLGVQEDDPGAERYRKDALLHEVPVRDVGRVGPFFLSKYELTQGQWYRLQGDQPSAKAAGMDDSGFPMIHLTHPVESVSWERCMAAMVELGLTLPTEAQWSLAAGGQSGLAFGGSAQPEWAAARASHRDLSFARVAKADLSKFLDDDGYFDHRPVDASTANINGLHDMLGNVKEWCLDWFCEGLAEPSLAEILPVTGELVPEYPANRSIRGGSFLSSADDLRISRRRRAQPSHSARDIGLRPACPATIRD